MPDSSRRILYCILNWGLGHATRSIPVVRALQEAGYTIDIASDGGPLELLRKTFPQCNTYELPGYDVQYPSRLLMINAISQVRRVFKGITAERNWIREHIVKIEYDAIISDNRYGCYHHSLPSVLITHVVHNMTSSSLLNIPAEWAVTHFLRPFDEIWIPDTADRALSGNMSQMSSSRLRFIGHLSDQDFHPLEKQYEVAAILSGPEPQRTILEEEILPQLLSYPGKCALVRGVIQDAGPVTKGQLTICQYMNREEINALLNSTELIVCRSGYSSLMDLMRVGAKALLIPTPGQPEQIFLGERMKDMPQFTVQRQGKVDILSALNRSKSTAPVQTPKPVNELLRGTVFQLSHVINAHSRHQ